MCEIKCGGRCCELFTFPLTPTELDRNLVALKNNEQEFELDDGIKRNTLVNKDLNYIKDMLIYRGLSRTLPEDGKMLEESKILVKEDDNKIRRNAEGKLVTPTYTCKHLTNGGLCGEYEKRPVMCKDYPYVGRKCNYKDCCEIKAEAEKLIE